MFTNIQTFIDTASTFTDLGVEGDGRGVTSFGTCNGDLVPHFCPGHSQYWAGVGAGQSKHILLSVLQQSQAHLNNSNNVSHHNEWISHIVTSFHHPNELQYSYSCNIYTVFYILKEDSVVDIRHKLYNSKFGNDI